MAWPRATRPRRRVWKRTSSQPGGAADDEARAPAMLIEPPQHGPDALALDMDGDDAERAELDATAPHGKRRVIVDQAFQVALELRREAVVGDEHQRCRRKKNATSPSPPMISSHESPPLERGAKP